MAHIVARSSDGPRGNSPLSPEERDAYSNLVLLCPTDHARIDKETTAFTVEYLLKIRTEHEGWVEQMLEVGQLKPVLLDNTEFLRQRIARWSEPGDQAWSFVALTPLVLSDDVVDPLRCNAADVIKRHCFPSYLKYALGVTPNPYCIEPSAAGLVAENFRQMSGGVAYRIECFRSGHVEYAVCLDEALNSIKPADLLTRPLRQPEGFSESRREQCERILRFDIWSDVFLSQVKLLVDLWNEANLPFRDMVLTTALFGVYRVCLFVAKDEWNCWVGRPAEDSVIRHAQVVSKRAGARDIAAPVIRWLANSFGLEMVEVFEPNGKLNLPVPLYRLGQ